MTNEFSHGAGAEAISLLKDRIQTDLVAAVRRQDRTVVSVLRMLRAAIHNAEIAKRVQEAGLDDAAVVAIVSSEAKRRTESIEAYERGGRKDLVDQERAELAVLYHYLPEPFSEGELERVVADAVAATGATSLKDLGKVMAALKPTVAGRADGAKVAELVRAKLAAG